MSAASYVFLSFIAMALLAFSLQTDTSNTPDPAVTTSANTTVNSTAPAGGKRDSVQAAPEPAASPATPDDAKPEANTNAAANR